MLAKGRIALLCATLLAAPASAQTPAADEPPRPVGLRPDDRRAEQPFTVPLFGVPVQLGGAWEYAAEQRRNFDLDDARVRDRRVNEHELKLDARALFSPRWSAFVQAAGLRESRRTEGTPGVQITRERERGQAWVRWDGVAGVPLAVQAGRVALLERRSWWWDDDLDAVRVTADTAPRGSMPASGPRTAPSVAGSGRPRGAGSGATHSISSGCTSATAPATSPPAPCCPTRTPPTGRTCAAPGSACVPAARPASTRASGSPTGPTWRG
jgi:hypothetical protein